MTVSTIEHVARKAEILRELHKGPGLLVLANAWDAASARAVQAAGFAAVATTSGGVALALGFADGERAPVDEMAGAAARVAAAVELPVTVDFEAGYRLTPAEVAHRLIGIGAAGMNIEDTDHHSGEPRLVEADMQAERLSAMKAAARAEGVDLVLNARVDVFIRGRAEPGDQLAEALRRARLYKQAGADCIYPITLADEHTIGELVRAAGTINVNVRRGGPLSLERASALGVRRVSYATSVFREVVAATEQIVREIHDEASGLS